MSSPNKSTSSFLLGGTFNLGSWGVNFTFFYYSTRMGLGGYFFSMGAFPFLRFVIGSSPFIEYSLRTYLSWTYFLISFREEFRLGFLRWCERYRLMRSLVEYSKNWFMVVLPSCIRAAQSLFHVSSFVDLTLVIEGPNARCAPEQFMQIKTPKSKEAPKSHISYSRGTCYCSQRNLHSKVFSKASQLSFLAGLG